MTLETLDALLEQVQIPARFSAGVAGSVVKDKSPDVLRYAFCFPDL